MTESQAERLKKELRFLKESFEAGIISEEEFNKGKKRIEGKLAEWGDAVVEEYESNQQKEEPEEEKTDNELDETQEIINSGKQERLVSFENKEKKPDRQRLEKKTEDVDIFDDEFTEDKPKKSHIWKIVSAILILTVIILFFRSAGNYEVNIESDLVVLNDVNCEECDTRGTENVIDNLFPGLTKTYVDYNTDEGKTLFRSLNLEYLPAYIFKANIEDTEKWQTNIKNSFEKRNEYYILLPGQTNSNWKP